MKYEVQKKIWRVMYDIDEYREKILKYELKKAWISEQLDHYRHIKRELEGKVQNEDINLMVLVNDMIDEYSRKVKYLENDLLVIKLQIENYQHMIENCESRINLLKKLLN